MSDAARAKPVLVGCLDEHHERADHQAFIICVTCTTDAFAAEQTAQRDAEIARLKERIEQTDQQVYELQNPMLPDGSVMSPTEMFTVWQEAEQRAVGLRQRLIDADMLHLADEQSVRNLERIVAGLRADLKRAEAGGHRLSDVATFQLQRAEGLRALVGMTFAAFSAANRARCESPQGFNHPLLGWSTSDWFTAVLGELGEAANVAKKLNRMRDGIPGNKETADELRANLSRELADTFIYLDLLCQSCGFTIGEAIGPVFDAKSKEIGYPALLADPEGQG